MFGEGEEYDKDKVTIIEIESGKRLHVFKQKKENPTFDSGGYFGNFGPLVVLSPDSSLLILGNNIWSLKTAKIVAKLSGHLSSVSSADFSRDGKLLATASADSTILVWDVAKRLKSFQKK